MVVLGVTTLGEHLTRGNVIGTGLVSVGTLIVIMAQYDVSTLTSGNLLRVGLLLFSVFSFATFSTFGKPLIERYYALETATSATVLSVPLFGALVPVVLYMHPSALDSVSVTLLVVGGVLYLRLLSTAAAWYC